MRKPPTTVRAHEDARNERVYISKGTPALTVHVTYMYI